MERVEVVVEVPAGGRIKRRPDGSIDFVSPLASPFNYGSVPAVRAEDGDPLDALILGPPLAVGSRETWSVWGRVRFLDAGVVDDKLICGPAAPSERDLAAIDAFFDRYAWFKRWLNRLRGRTGETKWLGRGPA